MIWYYAHEGARKGPVSREDLELALRRGELGRGSLVWREGMSQWQSLESVEELQSLLESVPPATPPMPPPLPSQAPPPLADVESQAASGADRASRGGEGPQSTRHPRSGRVKKTMVEELTKSSRWLVNKIANALWDRLFSQPATILVVISSLGAGAAYVVWLRPSTTEVQEARLTGQIRIDANPWGQVDWIHGPDGTRVALPEGRTTPFTMSLPAGTYQVQVTYPNASASQRCDLQVQPERLATCWLDLAPVDAKSYFGKIGW